MSDEILSRPTSDRNRVSMLRQKIETVIPATPTASETADHLFHHLWTKAVGTTDYVKDEWLRLEGILLGCKVPASEAAEEIVAADRVYYPQRYPYDEQHVLVLIRRALAANEPKLAPDRKHQTFCPIDGWGVQVDEDGCCAMCGSSAFGEGVDAVAAALAAGEEERTKRGGIIQVQREETEDLRDELSHVGPRLEDALNELRCPACGCADQIDAESKECGCDAPVCARTTGKTLAEDYAAGEKRWKVLDELGYKDGEDVARELRERDAAGEEERGRLLRNMGEATDDAVKILEQRDRYRAALERVLEYLEDARHVFTHTEPEGTQYVVNVHNAVQFVREQIGTAALNDGGEGE